MEAFEKFIENLSGFIWGGSWGTTEILPVGPVTVLLLGTGLYYMFRLAGRPLKRFFPTLGEVWRSRKGDGDPNTITAWQALSTALSGQVGTGNLAGVATALTLGGAGAIFWMWVTALFGMALAFAESSLAIKYREKDSNGRINGGPMYYIKNGLGPKWTWLAIIFCIGTLFSATATGGMVQANSITQTAVRSVTDLGWLAPGADPLMTKVIIGLILASLTFAVIIGGIKSIGNVAGKVVPLMALLYVTAAFIVLIINISEVPSALALIVKSAFGWQEAAGGFSGVMMQQAIRAGVARGLFSNEAGQGSAPIAHAAAQTKNPVKQGEIAMVGVFIDTLVICTMTALVILTTTGSWAAVGGGETQFIWEAANLEASAITNEAYASALPYGGWIVTICLALFAFTTIIGWSYYAEQAITYLVGEWATMPFRFIWVFVIFYGAIAKVGFVWLFGDLANASMAFPNLIAILALSGVVMAMHRKNGDPDTEDGDSIMLKGEGVE